MMMMIMTRKPSNKCCKNFVPHVREPKLFDLFQRKFAWNIYTKFRRLFCNSCFVCVVKVKVKQSHYRPGQAQRVPGS